MEKRKYHDQNVLQDQHFEELSKTVLEIRSELRMSLFSKVISLLKTIPLWAKLHFDSIENKRIKAGDPEKHHPIRPKRGQIFNAEIGENIGSELCGNHLVVVVQNDKGNVFSEKVSVVPIEGDGNKIIPAVHIQLTNDDLEEGHLDKDPSRVIIADITTIDKARLGIRIGSIKPEKMLEISRRIKKHLNL